jgi:hypothetical protein
MFRTLLLGIGALILDHFIAKYNGSAAIHVADQLALCHALPAMALSQPALLERFLTDLDPFAPESATTGQP